MTFVLLRRTTVAAAALALPLVLSGCGLFDGSNGGGGEDTRFIEGDGSVQTVASGDRDSAPNLQGETLQGDDLALGDYAGDVVVVNVWASWCAPCKAEAETLERVWQDVRPDGVQFIGINTRDDDDAARAHEETYGVTYPSLVDRDGVQLLGFRETLPPSSVPSTIVIDRAGRVAARALGPVTAAELVDMIEPLVAEQA